MKTSPLPRFQTHEVNASRAQNRINYTRIDDVTPMPRPEPVPDWPTAKRKWRWCWSVHVYGFGLLFVLLTVLTVVVLLNLNRKLRFQPTIVVVDLLLTVLGLSKCVALFGDPYASAGSLPEVIVHVLHGLTFPVVIGAYSLLGAVMSRMMRIPRWRKRSKGSVLGSLVLWVSLTAYFFLVVSVYALASKTRRLRYLLVITQVVFITWGVVLCFMFTYSSFLAARYAKETGRALRQIVTYCRARRELKRDGVGAAAGGAPSKGPGALGLQRIDRPVLDGCFDGAASGVSDGSTSSDESVVFYDNRKRNHGNGATKTTTKRTAVTPVERPGGAAEGDGETEKVEEEEEGDEGGEGESEDDNGNNRGNGSNTSKRNKRRGHGVSFCNSNNADNIFNNNNNNNNNNRRKSLSFVQPRGVAHGHRRHRDASIYLELLQCPHPLARTNRGYSDESGSTSDLSGVDLSGRFQSPSPGGGGGGGRLPADPIPGPAEASKDTGYMADAEVDSPRTSRKDKGKGQHRRRRFGLFRLNSKDKDTAKASGGTGGGGGGEGRCGGSPVHPGPYRLPTPGDHFGAVGLSRIRQGYLIKRIFTVAYLTTAAEVVMCVVQIYALFGVFGVFSNTPSADPWPWLTFQSIARTSELVFGFSIVWITNALGRQSRRRRRRRRRRSRRQLQGEQTRKSTSC